ncbi:hypothetical protein HN827_03480 [archaeon]|jgi:hypothetical protein|nr:hypothetical protein [archaeon]MBT4646641.1 hypothetical protein [archaeon]MBT6821910.1 hypothetical protein [archaeon]MBT7391864.1 hypothetical protein [archaeon]
MEITKRAKNAIKILFTDYLVDYNAHNLKDKLEISNVGTIKLLKRLEEKNILKSKKMGNATFYKVNTKNDYAIKLLELILMENDYSNYVKGWILDLGIFSNMTKSILLFGSVLKKGKKAGDIDVGFILKNSANYKKIQKKVNDINKNNRMKIHPLYMTEKNFEDKLKNKDKPIIEIVSSCAVIHGVELFVKVIKNVQI